MGKESFDRYSMYLCKENIDNVTPERFTIEYMRNNKSYKFLLSKRKYLKSPVADFGCGHGPLTILTARMGFRVTGFDCIEENVNNGNSLKQPNDDVQFVKCFLDHIAADDNSFASGILKEVLEHIIAPDIPEVLAEIKRVLIPNAPLIVTVPRESILKPMDSKQHVTFFRSPGELAVYLKKFGFKVRKREFNRIYRRICVIVENIKDE
jgi:2-polyprenyl-3-methyl-5-hydroxy-6-metoxy-1,4-benzoquinol methylase